MAAVRLTPANTALRSASSTGLRRIAPSIWSTSTKNCHLIAMPARFHRFVAARGISPPTLDADDKERRYQAEFHMMSNRLLGVVQQAVSAAVLGSRENAGGREPSREVLWAAAGAQPHKSQPGPATVSTTSVAAAGTTDTVAMASPAGLASAFLRCVEAQLQARKYGSVGDEAGDVLGSFPSATLFYYPGGGLQGVLEEVAAAACEAHCAAGPGEVVALVRALAVAVGRVGGQQSAAMETVRERATAVMTCLHGMADALEGATESYAVPAVPSPGAVERPAGAGLAGVPPALVMDTAATAAAAAAPTQHVARSAESQEFLREVVAILDCIAGPSSPSSRTVEGHTVSSNAPAHPLLAVMETRLFAKSTWAPNSATQIAAFLVDYVAGLLAPGHVGNTVCGAGSATRGSVCATLHAMARAQVALVSTLRDHGAEPAAASRLLAAFAEALAAACITRDAAEPLRGPRARAMFGEAQLLVGLSQMAAGEALSAAQAPAGSADAAVDAAFAADAAAGDSSADRRLAVSDASLVLEVLAAQAAMVAANHTAHIAQVLQDLRDLPRNLFTLSRLTEELLSPAAAAVANSSPTQEAAGGAASVLHRVTEGLGAHAAAAAAASVAVGNQGATAPGVHLPPGREGGRKEGDTAAAGGAQ